MHFDCRFNRDHQGNDHSVHVLSNKNPSKCVKPVLSPSPTREAPGSLSVSKSSDSSAHDCFRKSYKDFCAGHSCAIQYQHFRDWRWKDLWTLLNFSKYQRTLQKFLQTNRPKHIKTYQNISKHPIRLSHWKKATTSRPKESSRSCWCSSVNSSPSKGSQVLWGTTWFFFQVTTCSLNDHVKKLQKTLL